MFVINLKLPKVGSFIFCWNRPAPKNDEDPSKKLLEILDMEPISSRKHEMKLSNKKETMKSRHEETKQLIIFNERILFWNI